MSSFLLYLLSYTMCVIFMTVLPCQSFHIDSSIRVSNSNSNSVPQSPKRISYGNPEVPKTLRNIDLNSRTGRLLPNPKVYRCGEIGKEMVVNFVNPKYPDDDQETGDCAFRLVITSHDICQIRVDFVDTELMDPIRGECLSQAFTVEGSIWSTGLPPICGVNNDNHFYLHLENWAANTSIVDFKVATVIRGRPYRFGIWLTQIDCAAPNVLKAPPGCTQYLLSEHGSIKSFNYEGYRYLNSQDYKICIQPSRGVCAVKYEASAGDFGIKKSVQGPKEMLIRSGVGTSVCGTDYLLIPDGKDTAQSVRDGRLLFRRRSPPQIVVKPSPVANNKKKPQVPMSQDRYCGGNLSPTGGDTINKPVIARVRSNLIYVQFKSSPLQEMRTKIEAMNLTSGFKINYSQIKNCEDNLTDLVSLPPISKLVHAIHLPLGGREPLDGMEESTIASETFANGTFISSGASNTAGDSIDRGDIKDDDKIWEYLEEGEADDAEATDLYDYLN